VDEAARFVSENGVSVVYITLPMSRHPRILQLVRSLHDTIASVYFVPDFHSLNHIQARVEVVHGVPMIAVCESPFFGALSLAKRASDVLIAGLIVLFLSPLLIAVAIGVKATSPGPVIFKQRRYGLDGREILVYKFRSMTVTEDGATDYTQVTRGDSRVTPFGAFIRRTSLDELPQFFNVLEGSMSVVGPRPHAIAVNEHYRRLIPSYMFRHKVKPGITGWAQVNGYRGGDDLHGMTKRIQFDLEYLENWSMAFDLRIILRTFSLLFGDRAAW
jgi:putative colanic acid biosynthesis UDP-glucose lipid carrier transferase